MALKSSENDIIETFLWMEKCDNGDLIVKTAEVRPDELNHSHTVRVSTYGTNTPQEVKSAFYDLFKVLEKYELNKHFLEK
jgi:hypothetical protein